MGIPQNLPKGVTAASCGMNESEGLQDIEESLTEESLASLRIYPHSQGQEGLQRGRGGGDRYGTHCLSLPCIGLVYMSPVLM